jgi:hypothetical protein
VCVWASSSCLYCWLLFYLVFLFPCYCSCWLHLIIIFILWSLLFRYNDFKNDPLSRCNCTPPYSGFNTISARLDLNNPDGTYPIDELGFGLVGGFDMKASFVWKCVYVCICVYVSVCAFVCLCVCTYGSQWS